MAKTKSSRNRSLDGFRAYAILLIVASHCGFLSQGGVGNAIFFCLSGFFATSPFIEDGENKFTSLRKVGRYYCSRLLRVLPILYCVLLFVRFSVGVQWCGSNLSFIKNFAFIESYGHLWFLQQEMVMYLILPVIMLFLYGIKKLLTRFDESCKYAYLGCIVFLLVLTWLTYTYLTPNIFYLHGNGAHQTFRVWQFSVGMIAAYLFKLCRITQLDFTKCKWFCVIADVIVFAILVACIISSANVIGRFNPAFKKYYIGWEQPIWCTSLAAVATLLLTINANGILTRILACKLFAWMGEISFCIYLTHFFIVWLLGNMYSYSVQKFAMVFVLSLGCAALLHYFVEKPAIVFSKTLRWKDVKSYYQSLL